jgi:hypothetical protein
MIMIMIMISDEDDDDDDYREQFFRMRLKSSELLLFVFQSRTRPSVKAPSQNTNLLISPISTLTKNAIQPTHRRSTVF